MSDRPDDSNDPIDLRMYLRIDGRPLTETWIYQWTPPSVKDRKLALNSLRHCEFELPRMAHVVQAGSLKVTLCLTRRAQRDHMLAAGYDDAARLLQRHRKSGGLAHHECCANRNHDFARVRRYIEHAAIHWIALIATGVEYP